MVNLFHILKEQNVIRLVRLLLVWLGICLVLSLNLLSGEAWANTPTLQEQLKLVQAQLIQDGFITSRAYIDKQGKIAIVYGRVGKVILNDGSTPFPYFKRYLFDMLLEGQVLKLQQLQNIVALYNKMSSNHVKINIQPGQQPNTSDIVINNTYHPIWNVGAGYRYQDHIKLGYLTGSIQQPLGLNDVLSSSVHFNKNNLYFDLNYQIKDVVLSVDAKYHNNFLSRGAKYTPLNVSRFEQRYGIAYNKQFSVTQKSMLTTNSKLEFLKNKENINVGTQNIQLRHVQYLNGYLGANLLHVIDQDKRGYTYFEVNPQLKLGIIQGTTNGVYTNLILDASFHIKDIKSDVLTVLDDFSVKFFHMIKPGTQAPNDVEYQYSDATYQFSAEKATVARNKVRFIFQRNGWSFVPSLEFFAAWKSRFVSGLSMGLDVSQKYFMGSLQVGKTTQGKTFFNASLGFQYLGE